MRPIWIAFALALMTAGACFDGRKDGDEGGPCNPDGSCNFTTLVCRESRCQVNDPQPLCSL